MLEYIEVFRKRLAAKSNASFLLLVSLINLSACGDSNISDEFKAAVKLNDLKITSISISSPNTLSAPYIIEVGDEESFVAMAEINSGSSEAIDVTDQVSWSSSDTRIISINSSGRATGIIDGTVEIRAQLADLVGTQELTASSAEITSIAITNEDALANIGVCTSHQKFTAMGTYADGRSSNITSNVVWKSSVESVVEIDNEQDNEGTVTALVVGNTVITAEHEDGVVSNGWALAVTDTLDDITITPAGLTINSGKTQQFLAMGRYSDLDEDQDITNTVAWTTQNTDGGTAHLSFSAEVDEAGYASAVSEGEAQVTATCGDDSSFVTVIVEPPVTLDDVIINDDKDFERVTLSELSIQLKATLVYSDGENPTDVTKAEGSTWTVVSGSATLNDDLSKGEVYFTEVGNSVISVFYSDGDGNNVSKEISILVVED